MKFFKQWASTPDLSHSPIICNNNTMDIEFQVQMRQSDKCGSVRNDDIFNLHLGSGAGPWVSIPCILQDTSHIYWFHLPKQLTRKKTKNPEMRLNSQQIVLYCLGLCTQNPGLREVDLQPSPKERQWPDQDAEIRKKDPHFHYFFLFPCYC